MAVKESAKKQLAQLLPLHETIKQTRSAAEFDLYLKIVEEYKKIAREGVLSSIQVNKNGKVIPIYLK